MKADGTGAKRVTDVDERELEAVLSTDEKRIAFTVADPTNTGDIWVMNADGSGRKKLTSEPKGVQAFGPAWSPDGKRIAYSVAERLPADHAKVTFYVVDADGSNRRSFGPGLLPVWSPNGRQLLYTLPPQAAKGDPSLYLRNVDGDAARHLLHRGAAGVWSPDGKKIAFMTTNQDPNLSPDLQVMDADGSHAAPVSQAKTDKEDLIFGTQWSKDSKRIFFTRIPRVKAETAPPGM